MSQSEGIEMNTFSLVIFFFSFAMSLTSAEEEFSENKTPTTPNNSAPKPAEKAFKIPTPHQSPRRRPPQPHLLFPPSPPHTILLSDSTGDYHLTLHNFARGQPNDFQAALGAISAHILNQRGNGGHIPYPHPGHRGCEAGRRSEEEDPSPGDVDHRAVTFGGQRRGVRGGGFGYLEGEAPYWEQKSWRPF